MALGHCPSQPISIRITQVVKKNNHWLLPFNPTGYFTVMLVLSSHTDMSSTVHMILTFRDPWMWILLRLRAALDSLSECVWVSICVQALAVCT